ncbi:aspartate aminotransferase [Listeria phage LP-031]|uniref:Aspartate aminotransferase n=4 Tax=Homburgvirus LP114 TaxID=1921129 RepID=A0A514U732_9CAUD|nr:hypothetical protein FK482_0029 [Listeria phage LP-013]QDK04762.1 aspartate aminotransferase [Listeria phage LP-031]
MVKMEQIYALILVVTEQARQGFHITEAEVTTLRANLYTEMEETIKKFPDLKTEDIRDLIKHTTNYRILSTYKERTPEHILEETLRDMLDTYPYDIEDDEEFPNDIWNALLSISAGCSVEEVAKSLNTTTKGLQKFIDKYKKGDMRCGKIPR